PVDGQQPARLVVQPDTTRLVPGVQQGVLTLRFDDNSSRKINVFSVVLAPPAGTSERSVRAAQAECAATDLVTTLSDLGQDFVLPASYPKTLTAYVLDNCGVPMTDGSVGASFSNGAPLRPPAPVEE